MQLVEKHRQGIASESEAKIVETFYDKMQSHQPNDDLEQLLSPEKGEQLFDSILSKLPKKKKTSTFQPFYKVAAAVAFILAMGITIKHLTGNEKVTVSTAMGEQKEVLLKDGTMVTLSENSSLAYPETFGKRRTVVLKGRAYFSVKRDETSPFTVHTQDTDIVVLGTSFDVDASSSKSTTVSVITGKVQVNPKNHPKNKAVLIKNQQVTSSNADLSSIIPFKNQQPIAWTKMIVLKDTSLEEASEILESRYGISLTFESEDLKRLRISGKFKNETLDNILKSISFLKDLSFEYQNHNTISIKKKTNNSKYRG